MKYSEQTYLNCGFYPSCEGESNHQSKIVTLKYDRQCANCRKWQARGQKMLYEKALIEDEGWRDAHTCLHCLEKWIEHTGQHET